MNVDNAMPKGWTRVGQDVWRFTDGDAEVDVRHTMTGHIATAGGPFRREESEARADAIVLARAMTPGWVVVEQLVVWSLEDEVARLRSANGYLAQSVSTLQDEVAALIEELRTPWYTRLLRWLWP